MVIIAPDLGLPDNTLKPKRISDLQHSVDFGGSPWKVDVERVMGIEPTLSAWEAEVLPLNYTRLQPAL